jgi:hypothetical protein
MKIAMFESRDVRSRDVRSRDVLGSRRDESMPNCRQSAFSLGRIGLDRIRSPPQNETAQTEKSAPFNR